jgi:hypothetical protein
MRTKVILSTVAALFLTGILYVPPVIAQQSNRLVFTLHAKGSSIIF